MALKKSGAPGFTCSGVRHQAENVARFGINVKANIDVVLGQMDDEVGVVVHCGAKKTNIF